MKLQKTPIALALALTGAAPLVAQAAPTVSFKTPAAGATISSPINQSSACEVTGTNIKRVVFSIVSSTGKTTSLNTEGSAPWNCNIDPRNFASGQYTLRAVAYDATSGGASATATRSVTLQNGTTSGGTTTPPPTTTSGPTVSFKTPSDGAAITKAISQSSACEVVGSGISKVQFFLGSTALNTEGSAPWNCNIDPAKFAPGTYPLRAVAYNSAGASSSAQINVTIGSGTTTGGGTTTPPPPTTSGPTVSFKTPSDGAAITKAISQSSACEVVGSGIVKVQFFLGSTALNTEGSAPWNCNIDPAKFASGTYPLKAVAYNSAGASSSAQINVTIGTPTTANTPPSVGFAAPQVGATLSGQVNSTSCEANASDSNGSVAKVDFYVGSTLVTSKTAAPYQCAIDTTKFPNGTHTLMAVATDNQGASASAQRSVNISNSPLSGSVGGGTSVAAADIITRASADVPFAQQSGYNIQVINNYTSAPDLPESGIHGTTLPNGETLRFGKVADPMDSIRKALAFQVHTSDPITSSGKRSELSITPNIEMNKVYWIAFSAFVYDWGSLSTSDDALFGTQVHTGDNNAKVGGPSIALVTTQTGRKFQVYTRYSESSTPSGSNSVSVRHTEYDIPFGRWVDFVFKFKHNTSGNGFVQAWMDGQMIANYAGSLGFNTGMKDYAKFGYYNWSGTAMSSTARKVLLRSPTIVADPTGSTYSQEQVRGLVAAGSSSTSGSVSGTGGTTTTAGGGGLCTTIACAAQ